MADGDLVMSAWAPGVIGFAVSASMYGVTLGQSIYYARFFPQDSKFLKSLVLAILYVSSVHLIDESHDILSSLADTTHLIGGIQLYWFMLIACHRQYSQSCEDGLPWGIVIVIVFDTIITFVVQCFYCHRIWIISGKNKCVTAVILAAAILGTGSGTWLSVTSILSGSIRFAMSSPVILPMAGLNTVGDLAITGTVFKYMWKSAFRRRRSAIHDMAVIFINLGAFTCTISIILGIVYLVQGHGYWVTAAGMVVSRSYVNSMLAVLNARRVIRDRTAVMSFELSRVVYSFA